MAYLLKCISMAFLWQKKGYLDNLSYGTYISVDKNSSTNTETFY